MQVRFLKIASALNWNTRGAMHDCVVMYSAAKRVSGCGQSVTSCGAKRVSGVIRKREAEGLMYSGAKSGCDE